MKHLETAPYPFEKIRLEDCACGGCKLDTTCEPCVIKACANERPIHSCAECEAFPCEHIETFRNDGKPHHFDGVANLERIRTQGIEAWFAALEPELTCSCGQRLTWYYACLDHGDTR